jgi:DnaK suppressor protein
MYNPALNFWLRTLFMPAAKRVTRSGGAGKKKAAPAKKAAKPAKASRPAAKAAPKAKGAAKPKTAAKARTAAKAPAKAAAKPAAKARKAVATKARPSAKAPAYPAFSPTEPLDSSTLIHGIPPYVPAPGERYMSEQQLEHFRQILLAWKRELMEEVDRTVHHMQDEASNFPDPNDRATQESEFGLELRTRDRERKLLKKIDAALERIEDGTYGYCEETGEEIGLKRLEARPVATLSVEAQERRELAERQYGERDDRYR